ncbi:hypothetical protein SEA_BRAD_56 [Arthrobacter phage Brad]|uniref:Uncharacterized protein n=2 Tax=Jasminevirus adat TaxID=2560299 RepID=A0A249XNA3_9CAUD|nr:hypothetical protein GURGLEFERB_2 [Arthrobacter phage GurgleFerb]ASZ73209.1 hypothetical protein GURGLEFERB_56 [Arthrobacter phage GurgleFerb]AXH43691.1 hypothetical protein SEA_BRAD_2 [Arthrobacter phage Brad]AXH43744.1 hypothetical protein SEA_BRAD_56 [Arthrobacter phage Brad]
MFESKVIRSESFASTVEGYLMAEVELWIESISATESEYNVRTLYTTGKYEGSKFVHSEVRTVESHHSMKSALRTYNYELQSLGDPDYEAHKASN